MQLDEVYTKEIVEYQSGAISGYASNKPGVVANRLQCFMISSVYSSNKDIIGYVPVNNMDSVYLTTITKQIINNVCEAGFDIIAIVSDNNGINRKMFSSLCINDTIKTLQPYILHPLDSSKKTFLLFDFVHLMKCVRNNWLNTKTPYKTFTYPDLNNHSILRKASFQDLRDIYDLEKLMPLKKAPSLTFKSLYPHSLERQSVSLCLKVFDITNTIALEQYGIANSIISKVSIKVNIKDYKMLCH